MGLQAFCFFWTILGLNVSAQTSLWFRGGSNNFTSSSFSFIYPGCLHLCWGHWRQRACVLSLESFWCQRTYTWLSFESESWIPRRQVRWMTLNVTSDLSLEYSTVGSIRRHYLGRSDVNFWKWGTLSGLRWWSLWEQALLRLLLSCMKTWRKFRILDPIWKHLQSSWRMSWGWNSWNLILFHSSLHLKSKAQDGVLAVGLELFEWKINRHLGTFLKLNRGSRKMNKLFAEKCILFPF